MSAVNSVDRRPLPLPLAPDLRADVARHRADGRSWDAVGAALGYDPDALRRACADAAFAAAFDEAVAEAEQEAELRALRRLKALTASKNERVALKASEVILRYAREQRRACTGPAPTPKADPRAIEAPKPVEAAKPKAAATSGRNFVPKPQPAAFRAVPVLSAERLAELPLG